jgi:hypothetical protein
MAVHGIGQARRAGLGAPGLGGGWDRAGLTLQGWRDGRAGPAMARRRHGGRVGPVFGQGKGGLRQANRPKNRGCRILTTFGFNVKDVFFVPCSFLHA